MNSNIYERFESCCNTFQDLLLTGNFINKKTFENFLAEYSDVLTQFPNYDFSDDELLQKKLISITNNGYRVIKKRNEKFILKKLEEHKKYFDDMFKSIDENILLDEEQRKAILMDEDYSLIVAGAGAGKTITIAAKVKYLIEKCNVEPRKIMLLTYNPKSACELREIINNKFNLSVDVLTFQTLGINLIKKLYNQPKRIITNLSLYNYIKAYVTEVLFPDKEKFEHFIKTFKDYTKFDETSLFFTNFDEYFDNFVEIEYSKNESDIDDCINELVNSRLEKNKSIKGETLRNQSEVKIANYLYLNGFDYKYGKKYNDSAEEYLPDFTINYNGEEYYIEYYSMTKLTKNNSFSTNDSSLYNKLLQKKKYLNNLYNDKLIELYSETSDNIPLVDKLEEEFISKNLISNPRSKKEVFYQLLYTYKQLHYSEFIKLVIKFIDVFKENGYDYTQFDIIINQCDNDIQKKQLSTIKEIYNFYNSCIKANNEIDFNDVINYACDNIDQLNKSEFSFDYLIIDEYQDISNQSYNLIKKLSNLLNSKIVITSDDYNLDDCSLDLFNSFYDLLEYVQINKINTNYRNSKQLTEISSSLTNDGYINNEIDSDKEIKKPIEIWYYNDDSFAKQKILKNIICSIYKKHPSHKILLLGKFETDIIEYIESDYFKRGIDNKIICNLCKEAKLEFLTISKAKGLEYDQVIILDGNNSTKKEVNKIINNPLIQLLQNNQNFIQNNSERKMLYTALTRTKNKVYFITSNNNDSKFINEMSFSNNVRKKEAN